MIDWAKELPLIQATCLPACLDPLFLRTIRTVENGPEGAEFGVLSTAAPTYALQLKAACESVAHRLAIYPRNPLTRTPNGRRIRYADPWIAYFASIWAPVGVDNDPNGLNRHWFPNAQKTYDELTYEESIRQS